MKQESILTNNAFVCSYLWLNMSMKSCCLCVSGGGGIRVAGISKGAVKLILCDDIKVVE